MTRWIEDPDWSTPLGRQFRQRLVSVIGDADEIVTIMANAGILVGDHPIHATGRKLWESVTEEAGRTRRLDVLLDALSAYQALAPDIAQVRRADRSDSRASWYWPVPVEAARLLGPGEKQSLIARFDLGSRLMSVLAPDGLRVLKIGGAKGMGKSHTRLLLERLIDAHPGWQPVGLDVALEWPPEDYVGTDAPKISARDFAEQLSAALGMDPDYSAVRDEGDLARLARKLATALAGRYAERSSVRRVWFIDGLDRLYLGVDVEVFVSHLASKVVVGDIRNVRLIVTGYLGSFAGQVIEAMDEDRAEPVARTHIDEFFRVVADHARQPVELAELRELTDQTLAEAQLTDLAQMSDLARLGPAASRVAHRRFGPHA